MIKKSVSLWLPKYEEVDQGNVGEDESDPVEVCFIDLLQFLYKICEDMVRYTLCLYIYCKLEYFLSKNPSKVI
jgi:hypothetical protein